MIDGDPDLPKRIWKNFRGCREVEGYGPLSGNLFMCVEVRCLVFLGLYDSNAHIPYFETGVESSRYLPSEIHARQDQVLRNGMSEYALLLHRLEAA